MHELLLSYPSKTLPVCVADFDADVTKPRYVRVNTLKMDVDSAALKLGKHYMVVTL